MEIRFVDVHDKPYVDLSRIHELIKNEANLLHPSIESLRNSYAKGESVVMLDGNRPVGHIRFSHLLGPELRDAMGLPGKFPLIWESGSGIIDPDPEYRGNGYYADLRTDLMRRHADRIVGGEVLVLGTTKSLQVLRALSKAQEVGIDFQSCHHNDFPMVAAFTCICQGEFGQGFQLGEHCQSRLLGDIPLVSVSAKGDIACTMYVSSASLASRMDNVLRERFGYRPFLVQSLQRVNFYD